MKKAFLFLASTALLLAGCAKVEKEEIVQIIKSYLPNFDHIETGKSLDSKM